MAIVEEGQLKGSFKGFKDRETVFEFHGGGKWRVGGNGDFPKHALGEGLTRKN